MRQLARERLCRPRRGLSEAKPRSDLVNLHRWVDKVCYRVTVGTQGSQVLDGIYLALSRVGDFIQVMDVDEAFANASVSRWEVHSACDTLSAVVSQALSTSRGTTLYTCPMRWIPSALSKHGLAGRG